MKNIFSNLTLTIIFNIFISTNSFSQSTGIGTTTPHSSAALHVSSTTKGLLIPSMTSAQRTGIPLPSEGLIVYDLTSNRLYQYQLGAWKFFINNDYWVTNGTDVFNVGKNIGINTASPTERLQVNGNIRALGDLFTSGEIIMNNPAGILQLQNAAIDKGFVQISGDNLRLGTNSGNATGNVIIRMNGTDQVFIDELGRMGLNQSNPASRLDVNGNINMTGKITNTSLTGSSNLTPVCYGRIGPDGAILSGTGNFTVTKLSDGLFNVFCTGTTSNSIVVVTGFASNVLGTGIAYNGYSEVKGYNVTFNAPSISSLQFIIYTP